MVRLTDQEMTATEKKVCYTHRSQKEGAPPGNTPTQELPVSVRRQTERGKCEQDPLLWFPGEGTARQANRFRID